MASEVEICNRALQRLGAKRITSLTDDSRNARSCNASYFVLRDAELRAHPWSFSIKRAQLAADATAPLFEKARSFTLPSDSLRLYEDDPEVTANNKDWLIEGDKILTDDTAPLDIRYVRQVTDPNKMDVLFREALSARIAFELAEEITQSNAKKAAGLEAYKEAIANARRTNAIEKTSEKPPEDTWVTVRR